MQRLSALVFLLSFSQAHAQTASMNAEIPVDSSLGKATIHLDFGFDRPIPEAIHMNLDVLCADLRSTPDSLKPEAAQVLDGEKICAFDSYEYDQANDVLTVMYSTGGFEGEVPTCREHWKQSFDIKAVCQNWKDQSSVVASSDQVTEFSSRGRHHHHHYSSRRRVGAYEYYGSQFGQPNFFGDNSNSFFSGGLVGIPQRRSRYRGVSSDGFPRNSRREIVRCPNLEASGLSPCMSAIIAAESGCNAGVHHSGHGIGLCAIENDGRRHRFGSECSEIGSTSGQIRCCNAIYAQVGMAYFGGRTRRIAREACGR